MQRTAESAAMILFNTAFGGLFAVVFLFVVPSMVEGWLLKSLSIALGGLVGLGVALLAVGVALAWWSGVPPEGETGVCGCCGQSLAPKSAAGAEPGAASDGGGVAGP